MNIQYNPYFNALMLLLALFVLIYNYKRVLVNSSKGSSFFVLFVFMNAFSLLYRPKGDFWHYLEGYNGGRGFYGGSMEDFYYWLMDLIPNNYLLWRFAIWGVAALFIIMTFRKLQISSGLATLFFICFALVNTYYYTRNTLAMSIAYFGVTFVLANDSGKILVRYIKVILICGISWLLHRSMPLYFFVMIVALFIPYNKKTLIGLIVLFPVLYATTSIISSNILNFDIWIDQGERGEYYLGLNEISLANWKGVLSRVIGYVPIFYFLWIATKDYFNDKEKYGGDEYPFKFFLMATIIIIFISFLFQGHGGSAISGRIYKSAMFPLSFAVCYFFMKNWRTKQCDVFLMLFVIAKAWHYFEGYVLNPYLL